MTHKYKNAQGFTLVEMLISIVLTFILVVALYETIVSSQQAYEQARSSQNIIDKSRTVMHIFKLFIQQAGHRTINQVSMNTQQLEVTTAVNNLRWGINQIITANNNVNAFTLSDNTPTTVTAKIGTDILALRTFGADDGGIIRCDGSAINAETSETLIFLISATNTFICFDQTSGIVEIAEGVEQLQLLFSESNTWRYRSAVNVVNWGNIQSLQVGLLLSQEKSLNNYINNNQYTVLDETIAAENDFNIRQSVSETFLIYNQ